MPEGAESETEVRFEEVELVTGVLGAWMLVGSDVFA